MQARAAEDLKKLVTDKLVAAGLSTRREGIRDAAAAGACGRRHSGAPAGRQGGAQGPEGRRARAGRLRAFCSAAGLVVDRSGQGAGRQEGRLLRRGDREGGQACHRGDRRASCRRWRKAFPWPKSMRWGEASAKPARSTGCGRCIPSSRRSDRKPRSPTSCRSTSAASTSGDTTYGHRFMAPAPIKVKRLRRLRGEARRRQGRGRSGAPRADDPDRRQDARVRARLRAGRGRGAACRGRGPGRMAGGADGLVRQGIPGDPRRGDPRHHPQQPEMLRGARSEDSEAHQQVHSGGQHRGERRRQRHRRRLRAGDPRAAVATPSSSTRPI